MFCDDFLFDLACQICYDIQSGKGDDMCRTIDKEAYCPLDKLENKTLAAVG